MSALAIALIVCIVLLGARMAVILAGAAAALAVALLLAAFDGKDAAQSWLMLCGLAVALLGLRSFLRWSSR